MPLLLCNFYTSELVDWIQRLMPSGCSGDYLVRVSLPVESLLVGVVVCDVSVDGGMQIDDADEGSAFEVSLGQRGEETLHRVQP